MVMSSMMNDNELIWEEFLKESPWYVPALPDEFEKRMSSTDPEMIKEETYIGAYDDMSIFYKKEAILENYYILKGDEFAAYYQFEKTNGSIRTKITWNSKQHAGTLRKFLAGWIVPKYKMVESDGILTDRGFGMWEKMMTTNPQWEYFVKDYGKVYKLSNPKEVYYYKDILDKDPNSTFIVRYK